MNVESNLVNQVCVEQRSRELAATHQADLFALFALQLTDKPGRIVRNNLDGVVRILLQGAREDKGLHAGEGIALSLSLTFALALSPAFAHSDRYLIGLAAHQDRVKSFPIVGPDSSSFIAPHYPIDCVVFASDVIVQTVCAAKDYFAHLILLS